MRFPPNTPALLRESLVLLGAKRTMLQLEREHIETMVLGSSHGDFGFDPTYCPGSFNLCSRSQDLKHSYHLYQHVVANCPKLRNLVIVYSVFSPGNLMEISPTESEICPALNELFALKLQYEDGRLRSLAESLRGQLDDFATDLPGVRGFLPTEGKFFVPEGYGAERRAAEHLRLNRPTEAHAYLGEILSLAGRLGHRVCIAIPPARADYRAAAGESAKLFGALFDLLHGVDADVTLLNCYEDERFVPAYFGDFDHLLPLGEGTKLWSQLICSSVGAGKAPAPAPEQQLREAAELLQAGHLAEAGARYMAVLAADPDHAEANASLGRIAVAAGQAETGLPYFVAALNADPGNGPYWLDYIDALLLAGQKQEARKVLALAREHGLAGAKVDELAVRAGEPGGNPAGSKKGQRRHPRRGETEALLALFRKGRYQEVAAQARMLTRNYPQHDLSWKILGVALKLLGRNEEALPALQTAVELSPTDVEARYNLGVSLQELGRLDEAAASYQQALRLDARYADALLNLGATFHALGRLEEAEAKLREAITRRPGDASAHGNLGATLLDLGRLDEAEASFRRALDIAPRNAVTHNNLGTVLQRRERPEEAEACYRRALELAPDLADAHRHLGMVLHTQERLEEAEACFARALRIDPDDAEAHAHLSVVLQELGRLSEADAHSRLALLNDPDDVEKLGNRANLLRHMGRMKEARTYYWKAIELAPDNAELHARLGDVLSYLREFEDAEASYRKSIEIDPDDLSVQYWLGMSLQNQGRMEESEACFRRILEVDPKKVIVLSDLGQILQNLGRLDEAEACLRRAIELKPDLPQLYTNLLAFLSLRGSADKHALFAEHVAFARRFEPRLAEYRTGHKQSRDPDRVLQIGFVSGDFYNHAVASFIEPVLRQLAVCPQLVVHAYYNNFVEDEVSARLRAHFAHWNLVADLTDRELDEKMRADGIDVLIDLSGHTAGNRLLTLARKPAPVQASWLGYPGTTGLSSIDYYIADRFLLPPGKLDDQFTEKIVRLPATAPFQPEAHSPPVNELPALHNGFITFASFNRPSKLRRDVIALWSRLLRELPDARMLLGAMPKEGDYDNLIEWFGAEGITSDRLDFRPRSVMVEYLRLHQQVDLCLDSFPYNGGTTTHHALWMGVPTLTLAGDTMAGRVGAANLSHVGLEDFVAESADDFVARGLYWAGHPAELAALRAGMRERLLNSPLRRPELLGAALVKALRIMWQRWCAGLPAEPFEVSLADLETNHGESKP